MPISVASPRRAARIAPALRALVRAALRTVGERPGEISLLLTDDPTLRDLNQRYRALDRTTDVLSFAYDPAAPQAPATPRGCGKHPAVDGDIAISLDRVRAQARRYQVSPGRELARLVVHGALHLAGLEHPTPVARRRMRRREAEALRAAVAAIDTIDRWIGH